jgi:hypothetical protein
MLPQPSEIHTCYAAHSSEYNVVATGLSDVFVGTAKRLLPSFGAAKGLPCRPSDRDSRGWGGYVLTEANYVNVFFSRDEHIDSFPTAQKSWPTFERNFEQERQSSVTLQAQASTR